MVPWLAARPLSGHATPVRRQQAPPQAEVDRSTPRHPGQSYRESDPGPGRHRRSSQSYRDVEELLAERGVAVDHVTIYRWVHRFTPLLIDAARPCRHAPGDRWCVDETYVKVVGRWVYLYRAIDQFGQVIDVLASEKRDLAAARRFFTQALEHGPCPTEVSTDRAPAYPRVLDELLPSACHVTEQYANNAVEADHGRLKSRLRPMRGLKRLRSARVICTGHAFVQNLRRGHYELALDLDPNHRIPAAFAELALAI
jgi:IS6 family transposase